MHAHTHTNKQTQTSCKHSHTETECVYYHGLGRGGDEKGRRYKPEGSYPTAPLISHQLKITELSNPGHLTMHTHMRAHTYSEENNTMMLQAGNEIVCQKATAATFTILPEMTVLEGNRTSGLNDDGLPAKVALWEDKMPQPQPTSVYRTFWFWLVVTRHPGKRLQCVQNSTEGRVCFHFVDSQQEGGKHRNASTAAHFTKAFLMGDDCTIVFTLFDFYRVLRRVLQ